jgi:predicted membrane channel-forming protein YqfA (hemolysin III family)
MPKFRIIFAEILSLVKFLFAGTILPIISVTFHDRIFLYISGVILILNICGIKYLFLCLLEVDKKNKITLLCTESN